MVLYISELLSINTIKYTMRYSYQLLMQQCTKKIVQRTPLNNEKMDDMIIPEWSKQDFILVAFPTKNSDWLCCIDEVTKTYINIINTIAKYQKIIILTQELRTTKSYFKNHKNKLFVKFDYNDTWCRDYGAISVKIDNKIKVLDFIFNGWGNKFDAKKDNLVNQKLKLKGFFKNYLYEKKGFILEGGSIDTNGEILLTTTKCLLEKNRNPHLNKSKIELKLKNFFGIKKVIWLKNGALIGDDTDSHIDTLARFINKNTIVYQSAYESDKNFTQLNKMEKELIKISKKENFNLIKLPPITPQYFNNHQLPATYVNFLILNGAFLVPIYNDKNDKKVLEIFKKNVKNRDIIGIDCSTLIKQNGSLHCITKEFFKQH